MTMAIFCEKHSDHDYQRLPKEDLTLNRETILWFWELRCTKCGHMIRVQKTEEEHLETVKHRNGD